MLLFLFIVELKDRKRSRRNAGNVLWVWGLTNMDPSPRDLKRQPWKKLQSLPALVSSPIKQGYHLPCTTPEGSDITHANCLAHTMCSISRKWFFFFNQEKRTSFTNPNRFWCPAYLTLNIIPEPQQQAWKPGTDSLRTYMSVFHYRTGIYNLSPSLYLLKIEKVMVGKPLLASGKWMYGCCWWRLWQWWFCKWCQHPDSTNVRKGCVQKCCRECALQRKAVPMTE